MLIGRYVHRMANQYNDITSIGTLFELNYEHIQLGGKKNVNMNIGVM